MFDAADLSVLEFYKDLKTYWIKGLLPYHHYTTMQCNYSVALPYTGGGYAITGERSVHLVYAVLEFLTKGSQPLSLR